MFIAGTSVDVNNWLQCDIASILVQAFRTSALIFQKKGALSEEVFPRKNKYLWV